MGVFIRRKLCRHKTLLHFSSLTFSPWMFHHESEKMNENLETQWLCSKNPPPKAEKHTTRKTTTTRIHFLFVQVGRDLSIIFFVWHQNHGISQQMLTSDNGEKQGRATRNPTTRESVNWCSLTPRPASRTKRIPHLVPVEGGDGISPLQKIFNGCYFGDLPLQSVLEMRF